MFDVYPDHFREEIIQTDICYILSLSHQMSFDQYLTQNDDSLRQYPEVFFVPGELYYGEYQ